MACYVQNVIETLHAPAMDVKALCMRRTRMRKLIRAESKVSFHVKDHLNCPIEMKTKLLIFGETHSTLFQEKPFSGAREVI